MQNNKDSLIKQLRSCVNGYKPAQILMSAEEIGVFDAIARGADTVDQIARQINAPTQALEPILHALENLGILAAPAGRFSFTEYGSLLNPQVEGCQNSYLRYAASVKTLWNSLDVAATDPNRAKENFAAITGQNAEMSSRFLAAMDTNAKPQAKWLVNNFDFSNQDILDIGAGAGTYSAAVAKQYPTARIVAFDLPDVATHLGDNIEEAKLTQQITVTSGNYNAAIPGGAFDDVFLFAVIHQEPVDKTTDLLKRIKSALKESGRLFLTSFFVDDTRTKPDFSVIFAVEMLVMVPGGRVYSFRELEELLRAAGFRKIDKTISTPGPATLYVAS